MKNKKNIIIETKDRWAFFNEISFFFWNSIDVLDKMEKQMWGTFESCGQKYSFYANRYGFYRLSYE